MEGGSEQLAFMSPSSASLPEQTPLRGQSPGLRPKPQVPVNIGEVILQGTT